MLCGLKLILIEVNAWLKQKRNQFSEAKEEPFAIPLFAFCPCFLCGETGIWGLSKAFLIMSRNN
jgi:hypothetical protein